MTPDCLGRERHLGSRITRWFDFSFGGYEHAHTRNQDDRSERGGSGGMTRIAHIAATGIEVASRRIARSAHNVVNANTPRFEATREVPQARAEGGVTSLAVRTQAAPLVWIEDGREVVGSNTGLGLETIERMHALHAFKANLVMLEADGDSQRSLLRIRA